MCSLLSELCGAGALAASHGKQQTESAQEAPAKSGQANERRASVQQAPTMRARSELNIAEAEQQRALQQKVALSEGSNFCNIWENTLGTTRVRVQSSRQLMLIDSAVYSRRYRPHAWTSREVEVSPVIPFTSRYM